MPSKNPIKLLDSYSLIMGMNPIICMVFIKPQIGPGLPESILPAALPVIRHCVAVENVDLIC